MPDWWEVHPTPSVEHVVENRLCKHWAIIINTHALVLRLARGNDFQRSDERYTAFKMTQLIFHHSTVAADGVQE